MIAVGRTRQNSPSDHGLSRLRNSVSDRLQDEVPSRLGVSVFVFFCGPFSSRLQSEHLVGRAWFEARRQLGFRV